MKKLMSGLPFLFYNVLVNGLFFLYFTLVQPTLLARLERVPEQTDVALALFLVLMAVAELVGVWLKFPALRENLQAWYKESALGAFVCGMVALAHLGLIMSLFTLSTTQAFGLDWDNDPPFWLGLLGLIFFAAMIAKEGVLLEILTNVLKYPQNPTGHYVPSFFQDLYRRTSSLSTVLGDVLLTLFSAVAYTVTWERFFGGVPFLATTFWGRLGEYLTAAGLFCMVYPATQLPALIQTWYTRQSLKTRLISAGSFLLTMVIAIFSMPRV
ncbi:MAG TPA: hypothetical protein PLJ78_15920 [Anaerolineae bacterium]|nr:hypothetical protein [Anaerolineae bacterium]HQK15421.1 hypothetical protein [Anaerolineae bacterium]